MKRLGHSAKPGLSSPAGTDMQETAGIDLQPWMDSSATFSYSSSEMHIAGGKTHIKEKRVSFRSGRLKTEAFEAELPGAVHDHASRLSRQMSPDQAGSVIAKLVPLFLLLLGATDRQRHR